MKHFNNTKLLTLKYYIGTYTHINTDCICNLDGITQILYEKII